ncbi:hypothetical protein E2562_001598 [Oryza meyeriana var. granulata]|uniref:Uncharacterized protein n=1 Tax=Oryza meyeriana var. granulata TaxID=110450 RepID=A0A6G1CCF2_9ORYZ|nr:hypothetical protein E2562_001598 [Oryza meyeriana var. granulata]
MASGLCISINTTRRRLLLLLCLGQPPCPRPSAPGGRRHPPSGSTGDRAPASAPRLGHLPLPPSRTDDISTSSCEEFASKYTGTPGRRSLISVTGRSKAAEAEEMRAHGSDGETAAQGEGGQEGGEAGLNGEEGVGDCRARWFHGDDEEELGFLVAMGVESGKAWQ